MTSSLPSLRVDRDDLCGLKPSAGPRVPIATPPERQEIREWALGGLVAHLRSQWKNWQVEDDLAHED